MVISLVHYSSIVVISLSVEAVCAGSTLLLLCTGGHEDAHSVHSGEFLQDAGRCDVCQDIHQPEGAIRPAARPPQGQTQ